MRVHKRLMDKKAKEERGNIQMQFEIKSFTDTHKLCVITTKKGYGYACSWAIEKDENNNIISPTIEQVKEA